MDRFIKLFLLPDISKLSKFQREEYARLWFDLSKLVAGSLIIKGFEPGAAILSLRSAITLTVGL